MHKVVMAVVVTGFVTMAFAEAIFVGTDESRVVSVAEGQTASQAETMAVSSGARQLTKDGGGAWSLDSAVLLQVNPFSLTVVEGCLALSAGGTAPEVAAPTDLMNKAAIWFDASKAGTVRENGTDGILDWLDAREDVSAAASGAYLFPRAVPSRHLVDAVPTKDTYKGAAVVNFGCRRSGRYMMFFKPDGTTNELSNVCAVFAVQAITNSVGYLLGFTKAGIDVYRGNSHFVPGSTNGSSIDDVRKVRIWNLADAPTLINGARTYVDGRWHDSLGTSACLEGIHLLNVDLSATPESNINCFFNDRDYQKDSTTGNGRTEGGNRVGGDMLAEVLVFTNKLTETERLQVQAHLMSKWGLSGVSDLTLATARGSSVSFAAAAGHDLSLTGEGTAVKSSETEQFFQPMTDDRLVVAATNVTPRGSRSEQEYDLALKVRSTAAEGKAFRGDLRIESGSAVVNTPVPLALKAGETVDASMAVRGNVVSVAAGGDAESVVKTGAGSVTVDRLPEAVRKLAVQGGTLVLKAPAKESSASVLPRGGVAATIPNPSFEEGTWSDDVQQIASDGETGSLNGWTATVPKVASSGWDNWAAFYNYTKGSSKNVYSPNKNPPDGTASLWLNYAASASTTVHVPVAGVYEVSFRAAGGGWQSSLYQSFAIRLGKSADSLGKLALIAVGGGASASWPKYTYRTEYLEAGDYVLELANETKKQCSSFFDDFHMVNVAETDPAVVALPNGDLESKDEVVTGTSLSASVIPSGWTLEQAAGWTIGTPSVALASMAMGGDYSDVFKVRTGYRSLFFAGAGGKATLTNVAVKAGAYSLRAALGLRMKHNAYANVATLAATVTAGGVATDLGTVTQTLHDRTVVTWPNVFTLEEDGMVDIAVTQTSQSGLVADDFELVPAANLLKNGGLNGAADWTLFQSKVAGMTTGFETYGNDWDKYASPAYFEGNGYLLIRNEGGAVQQVKFPTAGLYRLQFHSHARYHSGSLQWAHNPVRAFLTDGVTTNELGRTLLDASEDVSAQFIRHVFDFRVTDASKTYTIGFSGTHTSWDYNQCVDAATLTRIDETACEPSPSVVSNLELSVSSGARVRLDYPGTMTVGKLWLGGARVKGTSIDADGNRTVTVSAADYPDYFYGPGLIKVSTPARGEVLIIR